MANIDFVQLFVTFAVLIASLTVHEAAHAWTAYRLGDPTARALGRLSLNPAVHVDPIGTILLPLVAFISNIPIIGWAKPVPVDIRNLRNGRRGFVLVAVAGPISNLLMACVASAVLRVMLPFAIEPGPAIEVTARVCLLALQLNVFLALFNMIPVPPLDGGNVLAGLLPVQAAAVFDQIRPFGFLIIYALMLTGVLRSFILPIASTIFDWLLP